MGAVTTVGRGACRAPSWTDATSSEGSPGAPSAPGAPTAVAEAQALLLPGRRLDAESRWWVLHTRSRQEKVLERTLRAIDVSCWVPLRLTRRRSRGRSEESLLPLFPGYLFLWGSRDEVFAADRTRRVAQVIDVPDQGQLEWELTNVSRALASGALLDPHPAFREGVRVRVVSGPFAGLEGTVRRRSAADRLVLQVRMLNTATSLDIDGELVEPADEPSHGPCALAAHGPRVPNRH